MATTSLVPCREYATQLFLIRDEWAPVSQATCSLTIVVVVGKTPLQSWRDERLEMNSTQTALRTEPLELVVALGLLIHPKTFPLATIHELEAPN